MELNDKQVKSNGPVKPEPEARGVGILLNAPNILARLIDTAVLLSLITGILYAWGTIYYSAFIQALGLESYAFAFNVPSNEVLIGGANTLAYLITGAPLAYWSVGLGLIVVIVFIALIQLILVPLLAKLLLFLAPLLTKLWHWIGSKLQKFAVFRKVHRLLGKLKRPAMNDSEHIIAQIWSSIEFYFVHGGVLLLLLVLLLWGANKSREFGREAAKRQLNDCPNVEVIYGEGEKLESTLCGRIGSGYILRSPEKRGKYVIIKESTIKRITIIQQETPTKP